MRARTFDEYRNDFPHIRMERSDDGILLMQFHNDGGELEWGFNVHHEISFVWRDVGADMGNKVIILTGAGDAFCRREAFKADHDLTDAAERARIWIAAAEHGRRIERDLLEIDTPMIAALNGPCVIHAEIPLLCDIVLAADHTIIADHVHYEYGFVPGDGVQTVWPLLMGLNRARYFLLMGQELDAQELRTLGLVNEVMPHEHLLPRAYDIARHIMRAPEMTTRLFRPTLLAHLKAQMSESVASGLMFEGMAAAAQFPPGTVRTPP